MRKVLESKKQVKGGLLGYRYTCRKCRVVLADTSVGRDGRPRGEANPGGYFAGRKLDVTEVPLCLAHPKANVAEEAVPEPEDRFFAYMDKREAAAAEAGAVLRKLGFGYWTTGGGCMAWGMEGDVDGDLVQVLVTTESGCDAPERCNEPIMVGASNAEDGEPLWLREFTGVTAFVEAVARGEVKLPGPVKPAPM